MTNKNRHKTGQGKRNLVVILTIAAVAVFGIAAWRADAVGTGKKDDSSKKAGFTKDDKATKSAKAKIDTDNPALILLNSGALDTTADEARAANNRTEAYSGKRMRLVKFSGPIQPEWYESLKKTGVEIIDYVPNYAYLVYGDLSSASRVEAFGKKENSPVAWNAEYTPAQRIDSAVYDRRDRLQNGAVPRGDDDLYTVQLYKDEFTNADTLAEISALQLAEPRSRAAYLHYVNITVPLTIAGVEQISRRPDVISIQPYFEPVKHDERQDIILTGTVTGNPAVPTPTNYLNYLISNGVDPNTLSSFAVNISDSGTDNGTTTPNHFALYKNGDPSSAANSRVIYNRLVGTAHNGGTMQGCDGHGNENSHIIAGYVPDGTVGGVNFGAAPHADAAGFRWDLGVAPFVKLGASVIFDPETFTSPVFQNLESQAYRDGARISSNSWGSDSNSYNTDAQQYDALVRDAQPDTACNAPNCVSSAGNQEYVIIFSAGNNGSGANTVGAPSTGKNVISVGSSENVSPFLGADGCAVGDTGADNASDMATFSGRGPTADGRKKPDIVAPGTHITAGVSQASLVSPAGSGIGAQLACFDASGVCGGINSGNFFPAGQQWYTASSGTSHSAPAISGIAAVIRQKFVNMSLAPPSPALTKGLLLNTARYLNGTGANDSLPSNSQGMGTANLNSFFDTINTPHAFHDQAAVETFTATGQQRIFTGSIASSSKPFRVSLAWTDAVGSTTGNPVVNNLDLEVTVGGNTYKGNVFSGSTSSTGGSADARNNIEHVIIPAGVTGNFVVKVKAMNIAGDGVPNNAQPLDQDFALIIYNANEAPLPVVTPGAATITAESCAAPNNAIDPGETVTMNFSFSNIGNANTTNLTATLLATGGVTAPSGPQNYGSLAANAAAVSKPFTFTVGSTCGQVLTATFQLTDGANNLGTVTVPLTVGLALLNSENFDSVTAPALPTGWAATNATGSAPLWVTSTTSPDTPPNTLFVDDPASAADKRIETPAFTIVTNSPQVSFRQNFDLENTFDGGVLEISSPNINGGAFTDITAAAVGGSFVSGGYTGTIAAATNAINGRQAWTGSSGGYIDTVANLGPNISGRQIKLRFRMSADGSVGAGGWRVDSFKLLIGYSCCGVAGTPLVFSSGTPTVVSESFTPQNGTPDPGETVTVNFPLRNTGTGDTSNLVATLQSSGGVFPVTTSQNYGALAANGAAVSRQFTFAANGACGSTITATLRLQDGTVDLGVVTFTFQLGVTNIVSVSSENFDGVTAPALPAGWSSTTTAGALPPWVTSTAGSDTPANNAFAQDISTTSTTELVSKSIVIPASGAQLTFRNLYNMEGTFDGVVLEMSINGGPYTDIVAAGGTFVSGGYSGTISSLFGSSIAGRQAWTGLSGGTTDAPAYVTTRINLPQSAAGQNVTFKWRDATDESQAAAGAAGVRIDSVAVTTSVLSCAAPASVASISGRVTDASGRALTNTPVLLTDSTGITRGALTSSFGYYQFTGIAGGASYTMRVTAKKLSFAPRSVTVNGDLTNVDFVANP